MFVILILQLVIIDVTENIQYVGINSTTGKKVIVPTIDEALGVMTSDGKVRYLSDKAFIEDWYNVKSIQEVNSIPEDFIPNKYQFIENEFVPYTGLVPLTVEQLQANLDYVAMIADIDIPSEV